MKSDMRTIHEIRTELVLTQAELANLLGKSRSTIWRWERDEVRLDITALKKDIGCIRCWREGWRT